MQEILKRVGNFIHRDGGEDLDSSAEGPVRTVPTLLPPYLPPTPGDDSGKVLSVHGGKRGTSRCLSAQLMPPLGHGLRDGIQS